MSAANTDASKAWPPAESAPLHPAPLCADLFGLGNTPKERPARNTLPTGASIPGMRQ